MSIKCCDDFISPMFVAVDVSPKGDVVIICDIDMRSEAEALLSHFGIYLVHILGSVVWEAFTVEYKLKMEAFQFCPKKKLRHRVRQLNYRFKRKLRCRIYQVWVHRRRPDFSKRNCVRSEKSDHSPSLS